MSMLLALYLYCFFFSNIHLFFCSFFFFFNDTATTEIYTLSLHDALPICGHHRREPTHSAPSEFASIVSGSRETPRLDQAPLDRKSTRLNSSHSQISYAVFCLKKKKKKQTNSHNIPTLLTRTLTIHNTTT